MTYTRAFDAMNSKWYITGAPDNEAILQQLLEPGEHLYMHTNPVNDLELIMAHW